MNWIKIDTENINHLPSIEVLAYNSSTNDVVYGFLHLNVTNEVICNRDGFSLLFPVTHYRLIELPD